MADALDPTRAVRFDLGQGIVATGSEERLCVVSADALEVLARALDTEVVGAMGRSIGAAIGKRVADRLGGGRGVRAATVDVVASHLGGELALAGFGQTTLECWGRAMVVSVAHPIVASDRLVCAVVAGALEGAGGRVVACEPLTRERGVLRMLVAREATVRRARNLIGSGVPWAEAIARLHGRLGAAP